MLIDKLHRVICLYFSATFIYCRQLLRNQYTDAERHPTSHHPSLIGAMASMATPCRPLIRIRLRQGLSPRNP